MAILGPELLYWDIHEAAFDVVQQLPKLRSLILTSPASDDVIDIWVTEFVDYCERLLPRGQYGGNKALDWCGFGVPGPSLLEGEGTGYRIGQRIGQKTGEGTG